MSTAPAVKRHPRSPGNGPSVRGGAERTPVLAGTRPWQPVDRLRRLGQAGRLAAFWANELSRHECAVWAAHFPDEPPLSDGEYLWIAHNLVG